MPFQPAWRNCSKCASMFYNGYPSKGFCPAGGGHTSEVLDFNLAFDVPGSSTSQDAWRFCEKCEALFFAGYGLPGVCKAGGGHLAQGLNFVLPHDVPQTSGTQGGWRFCIKCFVMFCSAFGVRSTCAAGGEHVAEGYDFVLPFESPVPAPAAGLGSSSNYFFHCFCNPIKALTVYVNITEDIVCSGLGWSIQLNCYSPKNEFDAWQQYVIQVYNPPFVDEPYAPVANTFISAIVNNWPLTGNYLINYADLLGGAQQYNRIPAGYRFSITLSTDESNNVISAVYNLFDQSGTSLGVNGLNLLQIPGVTAAEIAPIIAFELNIVGPFNSLPADFSSGAGTITYSGTLELRVSSTEPSCAEFGFGTGETANTFYSTLPESTDGAFVQSFHTSSAVPMIERVGKPRPPLTNMFNSLKLG